MPENWRTLLVSALRVSASNLEAERDDQFADDMDLISELAQKWTMEALNEAAEAFRQARHA